MSAPTLALAGKLQNRRSPLSRRFAFTPVALAACLMGAAPASFGLPQGATPTFGQTTVKQTAPGQMLIKQTTGRAGLDWTRFSIGAGERVVVQQPDGRSVLLNRVLGSDPSLIYGQLQSNGSVWLVNPRGIVFGAQSRVDVGGLVASTLSITNEDVASGRLQLGRTGGNPGELRSEGIIRAPDGTVALISPRLSHTGRIEAGRIGLVAATDVLVDVEGDGLIFFNVRNDGLDTRLSLLGNVLANGGSAEVRAAARAGFADTVLNLEGVVQARTLGQREGRIVIDGGTDGITRLAGRLDATGVNSGERGGSVQLLGDKVLVDRGAVADASGAAGGGSVLVGGDYQGKNPDVRNASMAVVMPGARLAANATGDGDGGRVIVWSNDATRFHGSVEARGGPQGGHGGFSEVSGKEFLDFQGSADLSSPKGRVGTLLLDPRDLTIGTVSDLNGTGPQNDDLTTGSVLFGANPTIDSFITSAAVTTLLASTNVILQANQDIKVTTEITVPSGGTRDLTLQAGRDIIVSQPITVLGSITLSSSDADSSTDAALGAVTVNAALTAGAAGSVTITNDRTNVSAGTGTHVVTSTITASTVNLTGSTNLNAGGSLAAGTVNVLVGNLTTAGPDQIGNTAALDLTGTLTLGGAETVGTLAGAGTGRIALGANTLSTAGNGSTTFAGIASGTGGLTKGGTGTLTLSGANAYTGATTIGVGVLQAANSAALGDNGVAPGTTSVTGGAALELTGGITVADAITLNGTGLGNAGALRNISGNNTLTGLVTLGSASRINSDADTLTLNVTAGNAVTGAFGLTVGGVGSTTIADPVATGAGTLTKAGTGTLTLSGANSYTGTTTIDAGELAIGVGANGSLASTAIDVNAGTLTLATGNNTRLANTATVTVDTGATFAIASVSEQIGTLALSGTLNGTGTLTATTYNLSGGTVATALGAGTVNSTGASALNANAAAAVVNVNSGTLTTDTTNRLLDTAALTVDGTLALGGAETVGTLAGASTGRITLGANTLTIGNGSSTFAGIASGTGGLTKDGTGTLTLSGANAYTGNTTITSGVLRASNNAALGDDGVTPGSTSVASNAALELAGGITVADAITLNGTGLGNAGALRNISGNNTVAGAVTLGSASRINSDAGTLTLNVAAGDAVTGAFALTVGGAGNTTIADPVATGAGTLTKDGAGTLALNGTLSSTTVNINGGTLSTNAVDLLADAAAINVATGTTLTMGGSDTIDSLVLAGTLSGTGTLIATTSATLAAASVQSHLSTATLSNTGNSTATADLIATTSASVVSGTLSIGAGAGTGSLSAPTTDIASGATLRFNRTGITALGTTTGPGTLLQAGSGELQLTGTVATDTVNATAGTLTLDASSTDHLADTATVTVGTGATFAIASASEQIGTLALSGTVNGAGSLTATTYNLSGGTVATALGTGTVNSTGNTALNANAGAAVVNVNSGTLTTDAADRLDDTSALTVNGTLVLGGAETVGTLAGAGTGRITLGANTLSTAGNGSTTFAGIASGGGGLTKAGTGTLTLSGANNYTGATTVDAGELAIGAAANGSLASTAINVNAGTLTLVAGNTTRLANTATVTVASGATFAVASTAEQIGTLSLSGTVNGTGTLTATTYNLSGGTVATALGAGTLNSTGASALNANAAATVVNVDSGTLTTDAAERLLDSAALTVDGTLVLGGAETVGTLNGASTGRITLGAGTLSTAGNGSTTFAGIASGTGGLSKAGTGTLTLSGANDYTGITTVSAGTLAVNAASSSATILVGSAGNLNTNGADLLSDSAALGIDGTLALGGNETVGTLAGTATGRLLLGTVAPNPFTLTTAGNGSTTFAGVVSEPGAGGGLVKNGNGTLTLSGNNSYTGSTAVGDNGTLLISGSSASTSITVGSGATLGTGSADRLLSTAAVNIDGVLTLGGNQTLGTLAGSGAVALGANTLATGAGGDSTFSGVLSGGAGSRLTKQGSSTFTLSGNNGYTGNTRVDGGTLAISGTSASASIDVVAGSLLLGAGNLIDNAATLNVNNGATLTLGGSDSVGSLLLSGRLNSTSGGTLTAATYTLAGGTADADLGKGALTSTGASSINGNFGTDSAPADSITVQSGTLTLGAASQIGNSTNVGLAGGATLTLGHSDTVATLTMAGTSITTTTVNGSGTLTAGNYALTHATISAALGGGVLTSDGNTRFNAAVGATDLTVQSGTLTVAGLNLLSSSAAVAVDAGATLQLNFSQSIDSLQLLGTLSGAALNADSYFLSNATQNNDLTGNSLTSSGTSFLNGSFTGGAVTVNNGTLTLGSAGRFLTAPDLTVNGTLSLGGNETLGSLSGSGRVQLAAGVVGARTLFTGVGGGSTFAGVLADNPSNDPSSSTLGLTKQGTSSLTLTGASTYSGTTTVAAGTLAVGGSLTSDALDVDAGTLTLNSGNTNRLNNSAVVTVDSGAVFRLLNSSEQIGTLALAGTLNGSGTLTAATYNLSSGTVDTALGSGTLNSTGTSALNANAAAGTVNVNSGTLSTDAAERLLNSAALTVAGTLAMGGNETVGTLAGSSNGRIALGTNTLSTSGNASTTFAGIASGSGGLTKAGTGTLTLSGANTYTGATTVDAGTLAIGVAANGSLASTAIDVNAGTLTLNTGSTTRLANTATVTVASGATFAVASTAEQIGTLALSGTVNGTGTLTAATYNLNGGTVATALGAGTLNSTGASLLNANAAATAVNVDSGTLTTNAAERLLNTAALRVDGTLVLGGNETVGSLSGSGRVDLGTGAATPSTLTSSGNANTSYSGSIVGDGNLTKNGSGTLTLGGNNAYSGRTTVGGSGTLAVNGTSASTVIVVGAGSTLSTAAAERLLDSAALSVNGLLTLGGSETVGSLSGSGAIDMGTGAATPFTLTSSGNANTTYAGTLAGDGNLTKNGNGTLTLSGNNSYSGSTTVGGGGSLAVTGTSDSTAIVVGAGSTLVTGAAERLLDAATLRVDGTLSLGGNETVGSLDGSGRVQLAASVSGAQTLFTGAGGSSTFSGVLADNPSNNPATNTLALNKQGGSVFTLTGANTYTGGTTVAAGSLAIGGSLASTSINLGAGALTLNAGNTNRLNDGAVVTVANGAVFSVLNTSEQIGTLALTGTLNGSGTLTAATYNLSNGTVNTALGAGTLNSTGTSALNANTAAGTVNVNSGTLSTDAAERLLNSAALTVAGTLALGGNETVGTLALTGTLDGNATLTASRYALGGGTVNADLGTGALTSTGASVINGAFGSGNTTADRITVASGVLTLGAGSQIGDTTQVTVAGGATLTLGRSDTIGSLTLGDGAATAATLNGTGTLTAASYALNSGEVAVNAALGGGTLTSAGTSSLASTSAAGTVQVTAGTLSLANGGRLTAVPAVDVSNGAVLQMGGAETFGTLQGSGTVELGAATLSTGSAGNAIFAGVITGSGNLRKQGAGSFTLTGTNAYTGLTTVEDGVLSVGNGGDGGSLATGAYVVDGTGTLRFAQSDNMTVARAISGAGGIEQAGRGTLTLSGGNKTYSGETRVSAGTLATAGNEDLPDASAVRVLGTGGLVLGGSETVGSVNADGGVQLGGNLTTSAGAMLLKGAVTVPFTGNRSDDIAVTDGIALTLSAPQIDATHPGNQWGRSVSLNSPGAVNFSSGRSGGQAGGALKNLVLGTVNIGNGGQIDSGALAMNGAFTLSGGTLVVQSGDLSLNGTLTQTGGSLDVNAGALTFDGALTLAGGAMRFTAGLITLNDLLTLSSGSMQLVSTAAKAISQPGDDLAGKVAGALPVAYASDVVQQPGGRIDLAETASLSVVSTQGGSIGLDAVGPAGEVVNRFAGVLAVRSGAENSAWDANKTTAPFDGRDYALQGRVRIDGSTVRIGRGSVDVGSASQGIAGIEADVVSIRAERLSTDAAAGDTPRAAIVARLPFDNTVGTESSVAGLTLTLAPGAFDQDFPFGQSGGSREININVGSQAWGIPPRTNPLNAGYLQVLPRGGAKGSTAVVLSGPSLGGGYQFFFDGAGQQSEIPVFYNGVLPVTPQVSGSISATVSVSESARKERFEEAVRTENVALRLRAGVIAEVGPGRPATQGSEGAAAPIGCTPQTGSLACQVSK